VGWLAGTAAFSLVRNERRIAIENLTRVFGDELSPSQIRKVARGVFRHLAIASIEWMILRRWPREKLRSTFAEVGETLERIEQAVRQGDVGVVGITAHLGNWELLNLFFATFTPGLVISVAKRAKFPPTHRFLHELRCVSGVDVYYTDESPRKMIRALKEGRLVGFLPDQELRTNGGIFVKFFDKPAYTPVFPVRLARKVGARMGFSALVRQGKSFKLFYDGPYEIPCTEDEENDLMHGTELWSRNLEDGIRKHPEQWIWLYQRWHSSPDRPRRHSNNEGESR
jgi:KDO2-lipid IV(A) lauroyltransferase